MRTRWLIPQALCLLASLSGCRAPGAVLVVDVALPQLPALWAAAFADPGYALQWRDPSGEIARLRAPRWTPGSLPQSIVLTANAYTPVIAWVEPGGTDYGLMPAGAIAPLDVEPSGSVLSLSFEQGAAAWLVDRLLGDAPAIPPGAADLERVCRSIRDTGQGDPWRVDLDALLASMVTGEPDCHRREEAEVVLSGSELGIWPAAQWVFWGSPFAARLDPGRPVQAPLGFHRLYVCDGTDRWVGGLLDLWVGPSEDLWIAR